MMYGFGDDSNPLESTTQLMEQYLIEFISNLSGRAFNRSMRGGHESIQLPDVIHYLRDDPKKFYRIPIVLNDKKRSQVDKMKKGKF